MHFFQELASCLMAFCVTALLHQVASQTNKEGLAPITKNVTKKIRQSQLPIGDLQDYAAEYDTYTYDPSCTSNEDCGGSGICKKEYWKWSVSKSFSFIRRCFCPDGFVDHGKIGQICKQSIYQICHANGTTIKNELGHLENCASFAEKNYCTKNGSYGTGWNKTLGTFANWTGNSGRSGLACPQCGCKAVVENAGEDCWIKCGKISGRCDWCGQGACCRQGLVGDGCKGTNGCPYKHCCVPADDVIFLMLIKWTYQEGYAGTDGDWHMVHQYGDFSPENAFKRQTLTSKPAFFGGKLPKTIWYYFWQPTLIRRISFRNRRESGYTANNPVDFEFVGGTKYQKWTVIQTFSGVEWSGNDEEKIYEIKNFESFNYYGIRVTNISGSDGPCIQDIKMWGLTYATQGVTLITWTNLEKNVGTDGSWSRFIKFGDFSPTNAFQRQNKSSRPAYLGGGLPKTIWYNLQQPAVIVKFSFRNRRESRHVTNNPRDFEFVGAPICGSWTPTWTVLQTFSGVIWLGNDEEKKFNIENTKLMMHNDISCFGIRIKKINGKYGPCIQDIKMWQPDSTQREIPLTLIKWSNMGGNVGTDGSWSGDFSPTNAFQQQTSTSKPAYLGGGLPTTIWYNLRQPTVIGKISFRNRRESGHTSNNPVDFEFVGATNCWRWTVIQTFSGVGWSDNNQEKTYNIENTNLMKSYGFSCYGIRVRKISGSYGACIQDIKMWQLTNATQGAISLTLIKWTNVGTDGSWTGVKSFGDFSPTKAFQRQTESLTSRPAYLGGGLPKTIWYNLRQPTLIGKISFRNRRESGHTSNNPIDFEFVGATNCENWTVIQTFSGVGWSGNDMEKMYIIENTDLMKSYGFSCYGIRVTKISGSGGACIQDIKMWQLPDGTEGGTF